MTVGLSCFSLQGVTYILRDNPKKIGMDAVRRKNVFLSIPDNLLTESQYSPIFRLIIEQQMTYLTSTLPSEHFRPIGIIIDEFYALGKLPSAEKVLSLARGYGLFLWILTQGISGIEKNYGREGARIILENCRIKNILECSDTQSADMLIKLCGKYADKSTTYATVSKGRGTISWHDKDVFSAADFINLAERGKTIVITPSGMHQIDKVQWYKIKTIVDMQKKIKEEDYGKPII